MRSKKGFVALGLFLGLAAILFFLALIYFGPLNGQKLFGLIGQKKQEQASLAEEKTQKTVPGEILVKFKAGVSEKNKDKVRKRYNLDKKATITKIGVENIKVSEKAKDKILNALSKHKFVEYAEPNFIGKVSDTIPNDPQFSQQWGPQKVKAPAAWDITTGSPLVIAAVVDTGVNTNHPDLAGKITVGYDFVNNDNDPMDDFPPSGHGSKVAGIIGAVTNNAVGMAGLSWQSPILPVKVCDAAGNCPYDTISNGIIYAVDQRAKVINLSLGDSTPSSTLEDAVNYAWSQGAVVVAAAGNNGSNPDTNRVLYPAAYPNVVAVGATSKDDPFFGNDQRASFSSYGPALDIIAPGDSIYSTNYSGGYTSGSGTSFSSPHVAGAAALLWAKGATSNSAVVDALYKGSLDINDPSHFGSGPGWDQYYGWGRLDIYNSLQKLSVPPADTTPPTTSVTSPASGSTVSGIIDITASASDNVGVTKVEFYVDGGLLGTDFSAPYLASWDTTTVGNGSHTLTTKAYDAAGNIGTSASVAVNVNNPIPDTQAPTTSITSPANGSTVSGTITILANASDNVAVASVSFFVDGVFIGEDTTGPYTIGWDTKTESNGNHTLQSKATDTSDNVGESAIVTINVSNTPSTPTPTPIPSPAHSPSPSPDTQQPTVAITSPINGSVVERKSKVTITADASDNVGVTKVEFLVNGSLLCSDVDTPYVCGWQVASGNANANYTITAKAYDAAGNNTFVSITVKSVK